MRWRAIALAPRAGVNRDFGECDCRERVENLLKVVVSVIPQTDFCRHGSRVGHALSHALTNRSDQVR